MLALLFSDKLKHAWKKSGRLMTYSTVIVLLFSLILVGCQENDSSVPCTSQKPSDKLVAMTDSLSKVLDWPDDLEISVFAGSAITPSPAVLTVSPTGEVYVGVDMNGSLQTKMGEGAIVRLVDCNQDGVMDSHTVFARVDDPRGIIAMGGDVYVLHTKYSTETKEPVGERLVKFEDKNNDGVADGEPVVLIKHMSNPTYLAKRGVDHATNQIQMGIDGWIYIAVGDYGFHNAIARDGIKLTMMGGGIVRVRPDGSEMEVYTHGLRNIYDVAISPTMDIFTRGNTNDGGGWNIRFIDQIQSGKYGYPMLFKHFTEEIIPALADLGGGSGTGGLYMDDSRWPDKYNNVAMMADWGRSYIYIHRLTPFGGTFKQTSEKFIEIPQPTDIAIGGSGVVYISAWAGATFSGDSTKGFTVRVVPKGLNPDGFPSLEEASVDELSKWLKSDNEKIRLYAQYELLQRPEQEAGQAALAVARNQQLPLDVRVAGIFTYAQIAGKNGIENLVKLTKDKTVQEFALRALADRKPYVNEVPIEPFIAALDSPSDRIKIAAIVGLGRLGRKEAVQPLLQNITVPASFKAPEFGAIGPHATPNAEIIPPHVAVQALLKIGATDALLDAVAKNHNELALWTLRYVHKPVVVKRLISIYKESNDADFKNKILHNLARIYHKEAPYTGTWWHTRPDTHGPYYDAIRWEATSEIKDFLINQWSASAEKMFAVMNSKYRLEIEKFGSAAEEEGKQREVDVNIKKITSEKGKVGKASFEEVMSTINKISGDVKKGKKLFIQQGCVACHNVSPSDVKKGPYLGQVGAIMNRRQIAKNILRPNATIAQGFATVSIKTEDGSGYVGFVTDETADKLVIRNIAGQSTTLKKTTIVSRKELKRSMMPPGLVNSLSYEEFASLIDFLVTQTE